MTTSSQENPNIEAQTVQQFRAMIDTLTLKRNALAASIREFDAGEITDLQGATTVLNETLRAIQTALPATYDQKSGPTEHSIEELLTSYWDQVENRKQTAGTGLKALDDILSGGLEPLRLVGVLGAPNCGKTTFVHQIAEHVANAGRPVLYVTSEDTPAALLGKTIARIGKVPYTAVLKGWKSEHAAINKTIADLMDRASCSRLRYLDAANGITMDEIRERARAHFSRFEGQEGNGPGVLVIDYLQRIARAIKFRSGLNKDLREVVSDVTDQLRSISYELNCTVITIASQNRTNYTRGEQGSMASAKESGDIEYTCDVMMALTEDKQRLAPNQQTAINLYVDKNRQGQRGKTVELNFWPDRQEFSLADKDKK